MKRPAWWDIPVRVPWPPPMWLPIVATLMAAFSAWLLVGEWHHGRWTPSPLEAIYLLLGFVAGVACLIPDRVWYRRRGDAYVRRIYRPGLAVRSWSFPLWLLLVQLLRSPLFAALPRCDEQLVEIGTCLGLIAWYPHARAVWKREQELREADDARLRQLTEPLPKR